MSIIINLYTTKDIHGEEKALNFIRIIEKYNLLPQKIGLYEPVSTNYTLDRFIKMWTHEEEGCYDVELEKFTGKAGGMMAKSSLPRFQFMVNWWECPDCTNLNYIWMQFPIKVFKNYKNEIEQLFKEIVMLFDAIYGYISHATAIDRQHVTGNLETRMDGVFWCNYFGGIYVEFFGEEKIYSFPWFKIEQNLNHGILTYLTEEPNKELVKSNELEMKAKKHLGFDSFGNPELEDEFAVDPQMRKVPKLD